MSNQNLNPHTIRLINGTTENKYPPYRGLGEQLSFEENNVIRKNKKRKTKLSVQKAKEHFLRYSGFMVLHQVRPNVFKKTSEEKLKLKQLKKTATFNG